MNTPKPLLSALAGLVLACLASPAVSAGTLLTNHPVANTSGASSTLHATSGKAIGFTTDSQPQVLESVTLHLDIPSSANLPVVALHAANGTSPGALVTTLANPAITTPSGFRDFTFTPANPPTLAANTTYYVTVRGSGSSANPLYWGNGSPTGSSWSGSATFAHSVYGSGGDPSGWTTPTGNYNWLRVRGAPIEPILTNHPITNHSGNASALNNTSGKAIGFTVGSHGFTLADVTLSLSITSLSNVPVVRVHNASGNQPGALVTTLTNPFFTAGGGYQSYTFTSPGGVSLAPGTGYYLTVHGTGSASYSFLWGNGSPTGTNWTGPATAGNAVWGTNSDPATWTSPSSVFNWFNLRGIEQPNPDAWLQVPLGGGGYVTGLVADASGTDIYARTDVGGVFRWVAAAGTWVSITDRIITTNTTGSEATMCISSIAIDPSDSNTLYVAAGRYGSTLRGIFVSTDRGVTWTSINTSISMDGNGPYRTFGERLAVDPNNPAVVWYGSSQNGLHKGVRSGSTWTWTQISTAAVPVGDTRAGVSFVVCDSNGGNTITYAGVFAASGSTGGVYRTTDNGTTWTKVGGVTLATPARAQMSSDGTLFVTGNNVVARLPRGGSLAAITPFLNPGSSPAVYYRGVAVTPGGQTLYVAEGYSATSGTSRIWRSTNAGSTWTTQGTTNFNHINLGLTATIARQEPDGTESCTGYWFGNISSLLVNPANANELWAADFFGVSRTQNAHLMGGTTAGNEPVWYTLQKGQDETVIEAVQNAPASAPLLTAGADVGGFRYDDLYSRPVGTGGTAFRNPGGANVTSLDFSEGDSDRWARTWTGNEAGGTLEGVPFYYGGGATSRDGGVTWLAFGEIDRSTVNSGPAGWQTWDLTSYLASQRAKGVTTVTLVVSSGDTPNYSSTTLYFDSNNATNSALRPQLVLNGSTTLAPSADTYVAGGAPDSTRGSEPILSVSQYYGVTANQRHAYLKFDLSAVSAVTSATLRLHRQTASAGLAYPVGIYGCANTTWSESTLTWNNRPRPYASRTGLPNWTHSYRTAAGLDLSGGRVAVSSTNPNRMVWMPFLRATVPHVSDDGGVTWNPSGGLPASINRLVGKSNPSYVLRQLASDRVNGNFYMTHLASTGSFSANHSVYRSTDGGVTWGLVGAIAAGTGNVYRTQLVAAPAANDVWFCDDGVNNLAAGGLWRSTDGGANWTRISTGIVTGVRQVSFGKAQSGSGYTVFIHGYLGGERGIHRSDNHGATWVPLDELPSGISIESLAGDRQLHDSVFIGTGGRGVFHRQ